MGWLHNGNQHCSNEHLDCWRSGTKSAGRSRSCSSFHPGTLYKCQWQDLVDYLSENHCNNCCYTNHSSTPIHSRPYPWHHKVIHLLGNCRPRWCHRHTHRYLPMYNRFLDHPMGNRVYLMHRARLSPILLRWVTVYPPGAIIDSIIPQNIDNRIIVKVGVTVVRGSAR